jgi:predicted lipoprotein
MMLKKYLILTTITLTLLIFACKKDEQDKVEAFDRGVMLRNYAENLVVPAYKDLQNNVATLQQKADQFISDISEEKLQDLQNTWIEAYKTFQYTNAYNFGPAGEQGLNKSFTEEVATFPVSISKVENILSTGTYNFNDFNRDARGFLTVEYLIFGKLNESNNDVLALFNNNEIRKNFLIACLANIKSRVDNVTNAWNTSFVNSFVSNNGTAAGSSTSQFYNEFVKSYETIKNFKIELPLGLRPGQTQAEPQLVEALYSGKTLEITKEHLKAIENIYHGRTKNGTDGIGFKEYLDNVTNGKQLVQSTLTQLEAVKNALNAIPENPSISEQIINNPQPIVAFGVELQKHTRFFKSDMSSLLGIAITYSSGDGD